MTSKKDPLWDDSDPYFAPGRMRRKRKSGYRYLWLPHKNDVKAGFLPKSRELPDGESDDAVRRRAALCRQYQRELVRWRQEGETARPHHTPGTWAAIIERYENDELSPFQRLQPSTQQNYSDYHRAIERRIGARPIAATTGEDLLRWHANFRKSAQKRGHAGWVQAKHCMGAIRRLAKYAVLTGHMEAASIETLFRSLQFRGGEARTVYPTWAQIEAFVREADAVGRGSIGTTILMMYELARRRSEIIGQYVKLRRGEPATGIVWNGKRWHPGILWSDIDSDWALHFRENKNRDKPARQFPLPKYPALYERLAGRPASARIGPLIISETSGRPYSVEQFRKEFDKIAAAAGWPDEIWSMDCRAGGATEIAEAVSEMGISDEVVLERLIESHTGHTTKNMTKRYARQTAQAIETVARLRQQHRNGDTGS